MKKLTLFMIMIASLTLTNKIYAKGNSGKDKSQKDKPERDKPERNKPEKKEQNIKAEDAQKNWGKLKGEYEDLSKSEQKEQKEEIKAKKRVRNEIRKELEKNPDLDLSLIPEYDPNHPNDLEKLVQKLIDDCSGNEVNKETLTTLEKELELAGVNSNSIDKIKKALLKYNENLGIPVESIDETKTSENLEKIEL